jgi:hypothetical protein
MITIERDTSNRAWARWAAAGLFAVSLVGSLAVSSDRFLLIIPAIASLVVTLKCGPMWLLAALPWLLVLNLEPILGGARGSGGLYVSEAALLGGFFAAAWLGRLRFDRLGWAVFAFAAWIVVAAIPETLSTGPMVLLRPIRLASMAVGGMALGRMAICASIHRFAGSIALWILFMAIAVGVEVVFFRGVLGDPAVGRLIGGSELLAICLTLLWPLVLAPALGGLGRRWLWWLGASAGACILVLTFSRSGWVGGWAALCVVSVLMVRQGRRKELWWIVGATLLLSIAAAASLATGWLPDFVPPRYAHRFLSLGGRGLFASRLQEWTVGLQAVIASPLWGDQGTPNSYNLILGVASRSGLPALLPLAWLVVSALIGSLKRSRSEDWIWSAGIVGSIVGLLVTGIGESSLGIRVMPVAMACLGIALSLKSTVQVSARSGENSEPAPDSSSPQR